MLPHHSEPARHVVHQPVDRLEGAVQQRVCIAEAVEVERAQQQPAVAPQLPKATATRPRLRATPLVPSVRTAQPAPAQRQSHGPGQLPPPAAAQTHATAPPAARPAFQTHTEEETQAPAVREDGGADELLVRGHHVLVERRAVTGRWSVRAGNRSRSRRKLPFVGWSSILTKTQRLLADDMC